MNAYLVTYKRLALENHKRIHEKITTLPQITQWWHYIPGTYLVICPNVWNATELSGELLERFDHEKNFLVIKVDLANADGWLPAEAWEWIRKHRGPSRY